MNKTIERQNHCNFRTHMLKFKFLRAGDFCGHSALSLVLTADGFKRFQTMESLQKKNGKIGQCHQCDVIIQF